MRNRSREGVIIGAVIVGFIVVIIGIAVLFLGTTSGASGAVLQFELNFETILGLALIIAGIILMALGIIM